MWRTTKAVVLSDTLSSPPRGPLEGRTDRWDFQLSRMALSMQGPSALLVFPRHSGTSPPRLTLPVIPPQQTAPGASPGRQ